MTAFPWRELVWEMTAAAVGTAAFSVLFSVRKSTTASVQPAGP